MVSVLASVSLSYGAGAVSTLSPCVLPILPIVLFGAFEQHAWGPAALAAGLATSFAVSEFLSRYSALASVSMRPYYTKPHKF